MSLIRSCIFLLYLTPLVLSAQPGLLDILEEETEPTKDLTIATFKATRVINSQSIETPAGGVLQFIIGHRFGRLNGGAYELWGIDNAETRAGTHRCRSPPPEMGQGPIG